MGDMRHPKTLDCMSRARNEIIKTTVVCVRFYLNEIPFVARRCRGTADTPNDDEHCSMYIYLTNANDFHVNINETVPHCLLLFYFSMFSPVSFFFSFLVCVFICVHIRRSDCMSCAVRVGETSSLYGHYHSYKDRWIDGGRGATELYGQY